MTRLLATVTCWVALAAVLLVSGGYTVHYLLAWQWSRAEFAGTAFVASLVVGAVLLVFTRLRRMEERLERRLADLASGTGVPATPYAAAVPPDRAPDEDRDDEPRPRLPWLTDTRVGLVAVPLVVAVVPIQIRAPEHGVFIPVFLASGLAVAAVAASVERLAARRSAGDRSAARRVSSGTMLVAAVAGAALAVVAVGALYWTAHYWGGPLGPGRTSFELEVRHDGPTPGKGPVAATAGRYCTLDAGLGARYRSVRVQPDGRVLLVVSPALDGAAVERLGGCLQDAILDGHSLVVRDVDAVTRHRPRGSALVPAG